MPRLRITGSFPRIRKRALGAVVLLLLGAWCCVAWLQLLTNAPESSPLRHVGHRPLDAEVAQDIQQSVIAVQDLPEASTITFSEGDAWSPSSVPVRPFRPKEQHAPSLSEPTRPRNVLPEISPKDMRIATTVMPPSTGLSTSEDSDSVGCKLPRLNPFDDIAMEFFERLQPVVCEGTLFTRYQGDTTMPRYPPSLKVVATADRGAPLRKISYQSILREDEHDGFILDDETPLDLKGTSVRPEGDFVKVTAVFTNGMTQTDYHARVVPKPDVIARRAKFTAGIPLNIAIVGFDGTSTGNFQRLLPETFAFLRDELKSFIFEGFSLLGEATTPQLTGLLTGRTLEENCAKHEGRRGYKDAAPIDEWPFIFRTLEEHGYATMFSEDAPEIAAFNMRLLGFKAPPCDHYARPFWAAVPHDPGTYLHDYCISSQPQHKLQLEYLTSLSEAYPDRPKFGFTFLSSLCHRYEISSLSTAAKDVLEFLRLLSDSGHLNNTLLVIMGDHGSRASSFRSTLLGKLEERLPFLSITVPEWLKQRYPQMVKNMKANTQRIITPLDLHATFNHLLHYPKDPSKSQITAGTSLFSEISPARTCAHAHIPDFFCPCVIWTPLEIGQAISVPLARTSVDFMNTLLTKNAHVRKLCSELRLTKIIRVMQEMPNRKVQLFKGIKDGIGLGIGQSEFDSKTGFDESSYQVQFQTDPGMGVFEASVRVIRGSRFVVQGEPSRINIYGPQATCIQHTHPYLAKFCFCKELSSF